MECRHFAACKGLSKALSLSCAMDALIQILTGLSTCLFDSGLRYQENQLLVVEIIKNTLSNTGSVGTFLSCVFLHAPSCFQGRNAGSNPVRASFGLSLAIEVGNRKKRRARVYVHTEGALADPFSFRPLSRLISLKQTFYSQ